MTAELLKKRDLGALLSMGADEARAFCHRHGVDPINVGTGKRASLRWMRSRVMEMLSTLQADGKPARRKPSTRNTVVGKTTAQIIRELACPVQ